MENKPKEKIKKSKPKMFSTKMLNIFACLSIALIFWVFNALSHDYSTVVKYPVRLIIDADKYISSGSLNKDVSVAVSGYGWSILAHSFGIQNQPILLSANDLSLQKIATEATLLPQLRSILPDIKILNIIEDTISFDIDHRESKRVFLTLDKSKISLPQGVKIDGFVQIIPAFIICNGARKNINNLPDTISFSLPNTFIEKNYNEEVEINYRPSREITLAYNTVKVKFAIAKK